MTKYSLLNSNQLPALNNRKLTLCFIQMLSSPVHQATEKSVLVAKQPGIEKRLTKMAGLQLGMCDVKTIK